MGQIQGISWAMAASVRTDGPCDRTAALDGSLDLTVSPFLLSIRSFLFFLIMHEGLCWFSPRDTSLDLAVHNQTANLDAGWLDGRFESHHRLGSWTKRLGMSQEARVAKGHELPRVLLAAFFLGGKGKQLAVGSAEAASHMSFLSLALC
ncbi:hypothetical protein IGI04_042335 [Brassica rapa subsp. trilocularis]|uniref:Uncharacterized protein n=1 Tax=Brassica rapa subsp. trilocularis TaxID=1813537 RepID=A0ABQ7KIK6_BRACM|nr:hypothetical protein IGI04_042335 [Brassica rapa subsp. trilocularis]